VEYVRFPVSFIAGSDTSDGRHGFELKLPSNYEANSSNSKAGTYPFENDQTINITSGSLQLIPPSFATAYEVKPYYGGSATKDSGTQIPLLDARDWYFDYFNGVFFQQDPSGTGDQADNPDFVEGYLYIGDMLDTVVSQGGGGGTGDNKAEYLVLAATGSLTAERVFTAGLGLNGTDGGAGSNYTLKVLDSIVATLTGSQFSGNVGVTGSFGAASNSIFGNNSSLSGVDNNFFVSGSIDSRGTTTRGTSVFGGDVVVSGTLSVNRGQAGVGSMFTITSDGKVGIGSDTPSHKLSVGGNMDLGEYLYHKNDTDTFIRFEDDAIHLEAGGKSFLKLSQAGTNKLILNNGQADVDLQVKSKGNANVFRIDAFNNSVYFGSNAGSGVDNNFWVSGSIGTKGTSTRGTAVFGGDVLSSGSLLVQNGITGSLTQLPDGTSYLRAGSNVTITSGSVGSITIGFDGDVSGETRTKHAYFLETQYNAGVAVPVASSDFSDASYNPQKIDIFVNGLLIHSGSVTQVDAGDRDYYISSATSLKFAFEIQVQDVIDVVVFSVSS
jgi:hypothetical protein